MTQPTEVQAWLPDERLTSCEWAERYHIIPRRGNAEPGPYRLDRVPYFREPLAALGDTSTNEVVLVKGAQIGGSVILKLAMGYWIDTQADNVLLVLPNREAAEEHLTDRIQPLLKEKRLSRWVTGRTYDMNRNRIDLLHCTVFLGYTGSPQSMASRTIRNAAFDETDKGQDLSREAAAMDLIRDRLITYRHRGKLFLLSTPTTTDGPIWQAWLSTADRRRFHVPCPHCGSFQPLEWEHVHWDQSGVRDYAQVLRIIDALLSGKLTAWYECADCSRRIDEVDRFPAVSKGHWVSEMGDDAGSVRRAYQISALYSPWVTFSRLVVEFLTGRGNRDLRNFYNSFLGIPHEEGTNKPDETLLAKRAGDHPAYIVPSWATVLTAGADTQARKGKPYWYWVVRAWGPDLKSRLIAWGIAHTPKDLMDATVNVSFPIEDTKGTVSPIVVCVDSGGAVELEDYEDSSTTLLVYRMALADRARVIPVRGSPKRFDRLIKASNVNYEPPGVPPTKVLLHTLNTEALKDQIAGLIREEDPVLWEESAAADKTYLEHMGAEEKTRVRVGRKFQVKWVNNTRKRNDLWDSTVYALAAAHMVKADERREKKVAVRGEQRQRQERRGETRHGGSFVRKREGPWIRER